MKKSFESKIRFNIFLIILLIIVACGGIFFYFYNFQERLATQKTEVENDFTALSRTNELIYSVNEAQSIAGFYVSTKRRRYLHSFRRHIKVIDSLIHEMSVDNNYPHHNEKLQEISRLLNQQAVTIAELNKQINKQNPVQIIHEKIQSYEPPVVKDTMYVTTVVQDTIVNKLPKRNFIKRLGAVFSPPKDSVILVKAHKTDTIKIEKNETPSIIMEVDSVAREASINYETNIREIDKRITDLIAFSQEISTKISSLLMELHRETLNSTLSAIQKNEQSLSQNYHYSLIGGGCLLFLIFVFTFLIINYANKESIAHKALKKANDRTKQLMESRHQLLLSVSHDIKTPLGSILGYLDLWNGEKRSEIESMRNSGKHILSLLENLLKFSSLEQGTLQVTENEFNLYDLYTDTADMFEPLARKKGLAFQRISPLQKDVHLLGDVIKIKQIIINILSNAVKYTVKGDVYFEMSYSEKMLTVRISDTGVGIPKEKQDEIFHAFSRVEDNNVVADGTGLGMYVVKGLIDMIGGTINVESETNRGTTMLLHIPVYEVERKERTPIDQSYKRIAIVDDDSVLLSVISDMLRKLGHTPINCHNPDEFEKLAKQADMILTDMEMGEISGQDILQRSRNIPVVIMTARADFSLKLAKDLGFSNYLPKPFSIEDLYTLFGGKYIKADKESYSTDIKPVTMVESAENRVCFPMLEDMFENDYEAIRDILTTFDIATNENIEKLRDCLSKDDFSGCQAICHKMLPMFAQLEAHESVVILKRMDSLRGSTQDKHPEWKNDIVQLIPQAENLRSIVKTY